MDIIKAFGKKYRIAIKCYHRGISLENIQRIADILGIEAYKLLVEDICNEN